MINASLKNLLGNVPGIATVYGAVRPGRPRTRYNLEQLAAHLPVAVEQARPHASSAPSRSRVLLFATLHYWIEQAAIVGLTLRGLGHDVTVAYLPFSNWDKPINTLDLRRQDRYTRRVLAPLQGLVHTISLLDWVTADALPAVLEKAVETQSEYDAMYSLQNEEVDRQSPLYRLRLARNRSAAGSAVRLLQAEKPDAVLIPNGLVTELGIFFQAAQHLGARAVTYEFNDQREQIWLAQDDIVMRQNTDALWSGCQARPLSRSQRAKIASLEGARRSAGVYGKGTRRWQDMASQGGDRVRRALGLDKRPVVLLPTNVLGDSLTLGRHLFAATMAEWVEATIRYFMARPEVQLVVRVHPGERLIKGTSMLDVVRRILTPDVHNIRVIGPSEPVNTYDVIDIAELGLVYTTTVGMEMAMKGVPVIAAGKTHYRGRGFTLDPASWTDYFRILDTVISNPYSHHLTRKQVETAWNYAYRFFFEYPFEFPWRLMHFWNDLKTWPVGRVLSDEGRASFGRTFRHLAGVPVVW